MTVVIGVVTVAVVPVGMVTVTAVIGVLTVAATVTGDVGIGTVGTETFGSPTVEASGDDPPAVVDETAVAGVASSPLEPCATVLTLEPPVVSKWLKCRLPERRLSARPVVRSAPFVRLPARAACAAAASSGPPAITRAAMTPVAARPPATTTAAAPFTTATCGRP